MPPSATDPELEALIRNITHTLAHSSVTEPVAKLLQSTQRKLLQVSTNVAAEPTFWNPLQDNFLKNHLRVGVIIQNADALIKASNQTAQEILGVSGQELHGKSFIDIFPYVTDQDHQAIPDHQRPIIQVSRTKKPLHNFIMGVYRAQHDEPLWITIDTDPVFDHNGHVYELISTFTNIGTTRQIEQTLYTGYRRYQLAVEASGVGVWDWELSSGHVYIDPRIKALLGYHDHEIANTFDAWSKHIHPDDLPQVIETAYDHIDGKTPVYELEYRVLHKDNSLRWLLLRGVALYNENGQAHQIIGTQLDISERKFAEAALQESEARFRQLTDTVPEAFWLAEPGDSELLYVSSAYARIWNIPLDKIYSSRVSFFENIHPADKEQVRAFYNSVQDYSVPHNNIEYRIIRPQGEERWVRASIFPITNPDGGIYRLAGMFEDITERKYSEKQSVDLTLERERVKVLAKFIEDASHDFRTPLTIINNNIYLLEMINDPQQQKHLLSVVKKQVSNITKLLDSMLTMSRLDTGVHLFIQPTDINQILQDLSQMLQPVTSKKGIKLRFDLANIPIIQADSEKIKQAFSNILWNAIRYNKIGGSIIIRTWLKGDFVIAEISDTGIGMDRKELAHIFERFYRVDNSRPSNQDTGGAGLGLSIARMIIESHGGTIEADSAEGVGSTFRITLST